MVTGILAALRGLPLVKGVLGFFTGGKLWLVAGLATAAVIGGLWLTNRVQAANYERTITKVEGQRDSAQNEITRLEGRVATLTDQITAINDGFTRERAQYETQITALQRSLEDQEDRRRRAEAARMALQGRIAADPQEAAAPISGILVDIDRMLRQPATTPAGGGGSVPAAEGTP